ncbi:MAG TPA: hypothetical protein VGD56_04555 [Gemmatirosa sp.]
MLDTVALTWPNAYRPDPDHLKYLRGLADVVQPPTVGARAVRALHACTRLLHMLPAPAEGDHTARAERQFFVRSARETAVSDLAAVVLACECLNEAAGFPASGPARPFDEEAAS